MKEVMKDIADIVTAISLSDTIFAANRVHFYIDIGNSADQGTR